VLLWRVRHAAIHWRKRSPVTEFEGLPRQSASIENIQRTQCDKLMSFVSQGMVIQVLGVEKFRTLTYDNIATRSLVNLLTELLLFF